MNHGREKRLLLGALALVAPLPLPFNEVIGWATLALHVAATSLFLRRARRDEPNWLSFRAMNLLGLAYLPFLLLDVTVLWQGRPLPPLVHLGMFALVVKLFGLQREKDKWHAFFGVFFLFLAAMGSSVHPTVVLYLLAWSGLALYTLMRFAALDLFSRHLPREAAPRVPLRGFLAGGLVFSVALAVPLFLMMPRLRTPYVLLPVGAPGAVSRVTGAQEDLTLDFIGRIRLDRSVALRARYESAPPPGHELRLKAGAYDRFDGVVWRGGARRRAMFEGTTVQRGAEGLFRVASGRLLAWMDIWLEPLEGAVLPMPVDGVGLDFPFGLQVPAVAVDSEGVVSLYSRPREGLHYRVGLSDGRQLTIPAAARRGPPLPAAAADEADRDPTGVTARIRELAEATAGEGTDLERARRIERHLLTQYAYTLDYLGGGGGNRVEDFLFLNRRGHCELFASALVLMLRAEGIPARLVSGFLGGEHNPIEGYYVVRQSNAHAWVEAWIDGAGWTTFDPTPPDGRPQVGEGGAFALAAQLYDFVVFRWDRYILTYGFTDQVGTLLGLRDLWLDLARWLSRRERRSAPPAATATPAPRREPGDSRPALGARESPVGWLSLAAVLALLLAWSWRRRQRFSATLAYRRLRDRLAGEPDRPLETLGPQEVSRRLAHRFPMAAEPVGRVVALYLDESFGGRELGPAERAELRAAERRARRTRRPPAA